MSTNGSNGPRGRRRAAVVRWAMLALGVLLFAGGVVWMVASRYDDPPHPLLHGTGLVGTPAGALLGERVLEHHRWAVGVCWAGLVLVTQCLFLWPRGKFRLRLKDSGPPVWWSAVGAGFIAMLLSVGLVAALLTFGRVWRETFEKLDTYWPALAAMGVIWLLWAVLLAWYWRGMDRATALSRTMRWLIGGTVLETLVAGPVHVWVARQDDCYCARGSYTGLVFGLTAVVWLFGPGVFLLFARERDRRAALLNPREP